MKFIIKHRIKGRLRVHFVQGQMTCEQADKAEYYFQSLAFVTKAKLYEQTCDAVIEYSGGEAQILEALKKFSYQQVKAPAEVVENSDRRLNAEYKEKLLEKVLFRVFSKYCLPFYIRAVILIYKAFKYVKAGIKSLMHKKLEVSVLDAAAIGVSILRADFNTAGSVMFMLELGGILEEWTHRKSVGDLARSMSLNVGRVWLADGEQRFAVNTSDIKPGDRVCICAGSLIPFDGEVYSGTATVNQASLTGESLPVTKESSDYVYAGTVVEEGELIITVKKANGATKYEKIVNMIEKSEKLKSSAESKAEHLADKLVPYTFLGTAAAWLITRNITKTLSVLMVDFSCALKLAMPITVLSAIREANLHSFTVKGGKYLEAMAEATTIVFDKTGTLTKAQPTVKRVIPFMPEPEDELLRIAACLEEHFPHSMANAVVRAAKEKILFMMRCTQRLIISLPTASLLIWAKQGWL